MVKKPSGERLWAIAYAAEAFGHASQQVLKTKRDLQRGTDPADQLKLAFDRRRLLELVLDMRRALDPFWHCQNLVFSGWSPSTQKYASNIFHAFHITYDHAGFPEDPSRTNFLDSILQRDGPLDTELLMNHTLAGVGDVLFERFEMIGQDISSDAIELQESLWSDLSDEPDFLMIEPPSTAVTNPNHASAAPDKPVIELSDRVRRERPRAKYQALLIDVAKPGLLVSYAEIAERVYGDESTSGEAIEKLVDRANETLVDLGERARFRYGGENVWRDDSPE
jgi:hypothetical protein